MTPLPPLESPGASPAPVQPGHGPAATDERPRAQALNCGPFSVAVPHGMARAAVGPLELSTVPLAPAWLAGATNIDGQIVPVLDLAAWVDPALAAPAAAPHPRALLVGHGTAAAAVLFTGLPRLVRLEPQPTSPRPADALTPFVIGQAADEPEVRAIDAAALIRAMTRSLADAPA